MRISDWSSDVCSSDLCGCPVMIYCYKINPTRPGGRALVGVRAPLVDKAGPWRDQAKLSCGGPAVALDQGHDDCGKQPEADRQHAAGAAQGAERGNRQRNLGQRSEEHTSELPSLMRISS